MEDKNIRISYDDKPSFKERIKKQAKRENRNMNNMIHVALEIYLDSKDRLKTPSKRF